MSDPRGWEWVVDTLLCFFSCSLGAVSGLVAGTLLGWEAGLSAALAVALAPASCLFLTECPVARRLGLVLKQYG
jgi:hypothetical protein